MKTYIHFWYLAKFLEWEMFQTKVSDKIKMRILCSITFFFFGNRTIYEMVENTVEPGTPQMKNKEHAHCVQDT